mgnify:FL=1
MVHTIDNKSLCDILLNYFQNLTTVLCNASRFRNSKPCVSQEDLVGFFEVKAVSNLSLDPSVGIFSILRKLRPCLVFQLPSSFS